MFQQHVDVYNLYANYKYIKDLRHVNNPGDPLYQEAEGVRKLLRDHGLKLEKGVSWKSIIGDLFVKVVKPTNKGLTKKELINKLLYAEMYYIAVGQFGLGILVLAGRHIRKM